MVFKLQRAQRVGDVFQRIFERMREIIHRINAPGIAGVVMRRVHDAVQHRIAHVHVGRCHVDLCPQHALTLLELTTAHLFKQREVFLNRAITACGMRSRGGEVASLDPHFLGRIVLHISLTGLDQMNRAFVKKTEIIAREIKVITPIESQPTHIPLDALDILGFLLLRIRVIEPQMAFRIGFGILLRNAEIQANRLGVPDVQVAIRLGRKARDRRGMHTARKITRNDVADEIAFLNWFGFGHGKLKLGNHERHEGHDGEQQILLMPIFAYPLFHFVTLRVFRGSKSSALRQLPQQGPVHAHAGFKVLDSKVFIRRMNLRVGQGET